MNKEKLNEKGEVKVNSRMSDVRFPLRVHLCTRFATLCSVQDEKKNKGKNLSHTKQTIKQKKSRTVA